MTIALQAINARSACDELRAKVQADHVSVHPDQLEIPEHRLREIKPETIRKLAESIKEVGLLQPIGVKYAGALSNRFIVIYGAHRALAFQLLRREALEKATDPNTDQEVFRYSQVHALRFRKEIDDEVCEELEIRENLDRKELSFNERKAHALLLGAVIQKRETKRRQTEAKKGKMHNADAQQKSTVKRGIMRGKPVANAVAEAIGIDRSTLDSRVTSASSDIGILLDLDKTSPEDLRAAAKMILEKEPVKRNGRTATPSAGRLSAKGLELLCDIYPARPHLFSAWLEKRHPASFSLDDIRGFRDVLIELVKKLEA